MDISYLIRKTPNEKHKNKNKNSKSQSQIDSPSSSYSSSQNIIAMAVPSASSSSSSNIMLVICKKKTTSVELYRPLRNYITFNYSECKAQNLEDNLQTLKQYHTDLERTPDPTPTTHRDLLQNYFKALCLVETRFSISPDKNSVNTVTFTWFDAFKPKQRRCSRTFTWRRR